MSSPIIQADYEKLAEIASRFERRSSDTAQMLQAINRMANVLVDGDWEGRGLQAFHTEMMVDVLPALRRLIEALAQSGATTLEIAQIMRAAEEEAARPFQSDGVGADSGSGASEQKDSWWNRWGEWVHGGLDVLGLVPGFGEVADGINGLIYTAEGRKLEAGLSFAAMIPFAGWGATGSKFALRAGREILEEGAERVAREGVEEVAEGGLRRGADEAVGGIRRVADDPPASVTVASGHKSVRDPSFLKYGELAPNTSYTRNGYDYVTDANGRVSQVSGELRLVDDTPRYGDYENKVGKMGLDGDHGGHLIGNRFGGSSEGVNLVPQNGNFNQGAYNQLEKQWADAIAEGKRVEVNIDLQYPRSSSRPDSYSIEYKITDPRTGQEVIEEVFFINRPGGV